MKKYDNSYWLYSFLMLGVVNEARGEKTYIVGIDLSLSL